jgi:hypothetical protein
MLPTIISCVGLPFCVCTSYDMFKTRGALLSIRLCQSLCFLVLSSNNTPDGVLTNNVTSLFQTWSAIRASKSVCIVVFYDQLDYV